MLTLFYLGCGSSPPFKGTWESSSVKLELWGWNRGAWIENGQSTEIRWNAFRTKPVFLTANMCTGEQECEVPTMEFDWEDGIKLGDVDVLCVVSYVGPVRFGQQSVKFGELNRLSCGPNPREPEHRFVRKD